MFTNKFKTTELCSLPFRSVAVNTLLLLVKIQSPLWLRRFKIPLGPSVSSSADVSIILDRSARISMGVRMHSFYHLQGWTDYIPYMLKVFDVNSNRDLYETQSLLNFL